MRDERQEAIDKILEDGFGMDIFFDNGVTMARWGISEQMDMFSEMSVYARVNGFKSKVIVL